MQNFNSSSELEGELLIMIDESNPNRRRYGLKMKILLDIYLT